MSSRRGSGPGSRRGSSGSRERRTSSLLFPIIGAIIGFIAALFLLRELDIFEGDQAPVGPVVNQACDYPPGGYFDRLCNLVAHATVEIQTAIAPEVAEACVEQQSECRTHRESLRQGLPTIERFRDALFELDPPEQAEDWHGRYLTAIAQLHSAYNAQFRALQENDREGFLEAHERTTGAAEDAGTLFEDFQIAFTDERGP